LVTKYKVKFLPDDKEIEVVKGATLLEAAEKADIYINSLCGGEGLCGECRLQVTGGKARAIGQDGKSIHLLMVSE